MLQVHQSRRVGVLAFLLCGCILTGCDTRSSSDVSSKQLVNQTESASASVIEQAPTQLENGDTTTPSNSQTNATVLEKEDVAQTPQLSAAEFIRRWKDGEQNGREIRVKGTTSETDLQEIVKFLRESFPFRSITHRLVEVESDLKLKKLAEFNSINEAKSTDQELEVGDSREYRALEQLHSDSATNFVQADGFGFYRITPISPSDLPRRSRGPLALNTEYRSATELEYGPMIELPNHRTNSAAEANDSDPTNETALAFQMPTREALTLLSRQGTYQFGDRGNTGIVRNEDEVAGFQGHEVQDLWSSDLGINLTEPEQFADAKVKWKVNRMELVSLLANDEFGVYVSESLPKMDELKDVETRKLDEFEFSALGRLFKGEDVVLEATANRIRMLGALRATQNCLECHSVKKGDLLGALSYELLRKPKVDVARVGAQLGNQ